MKKIVIIILFSIIFTTLPSYGQIQVFLKNTKNEKSEPDINIFGYAGKLNNSGSLKLTYFALIERSWAEGLIGISYSPTNWCELGLQFGIESISSLYRMCSSIWLGNEKISYFFCFEKGIGKDNWWYKTTLEAQPAKKFSYGLISWRYNGTGVFIKKKFYNKISLWVSPTHDIEFNKTRLTIGFDIKI